MSRLVTVYDDLEPLNNVICALSLEIDEVAFIYHHEAARNNFDNIEEVIGQYLPETYVEFVKLVDDEEQINGLLSADTETIIDVGGAKYLSLLLFHKALESGKQIIYYDDEENVIKNYRDHSVLIEDVFRLTINDILLLRGGVVKEYMHEPTRDKKSQEAVIELVEKNLDNYQAFVRYLTELNTLVKNQSQISPLTYKLDAQQKNRIMNDTSYKNCRALFNIVDDKLVFTSGRLRDKIATSGAFLENYLFSKLSASEAFDEVEMSVVIDFSEDKYDHPVRCEIDCLVLENNHLLMISCKSSKAQTEDLNEIFVHNTMFGNALSSPVLCVGEELDHRYPSIYAKAEELGIYIIDRSDLKHTGVVEVFRSIFDGDYEYDILY